MRLLCVDVYIKRPRCLAAHASLRSGMCTCMQAFVYVNM